MKARTVVLLTGMAGAGTALARMMRRRNQQTHKQKAKRPGWRRLAGLVGTDMARKAMRRRHA